MSYACPPYIFSLWMYLKGLYILIVRTISLGFKLRIGFVSEFLTLKKNDGNKLEKVNS